MPASKILVFGAGNLLLSDEGFGVHFVKYLQTHFTFTDEVELFDAGTLGMMATHKLEEAESVYIVDVVDAPGPPGTVLRFEREDFLLKRLPLKLSPHQAGVQEMLLVSELRGHAPSELTLFGVIPESLAPSVELSPAVAARLPEVASLLMDDLRRKGHAGVMARTV